MLQRVNSHFALIVLLAFCMSFHIFRGSWHPVGLWWREVYVEFNLKPSVIPLRRAKGKPLNGAKKEGGEDRGRTDHIFNF